MPGTIAQGFSQVVTVTTSTRIGLNSDVGSKAYIEATSGVPGSAVKQKLATHDGGFAVYGPFGVGTVTIFAASGPVFYDEADPVESDNARFPVVADPTTGILYANGSPVSGAGNLLSAGTMVCDWTTGGTLAVTGSAGATAVLDASNSIAGLQALRITMGGTGTLQVTFTFSTPISLAYFKTMQLPFRFSRNSSDDGATPIFALPVLWLIGASGSQWRYNLTPSGWRSGAWRTWSIAPGGSTQGWTFGGSPLPTDTTGLDTDTITAIRLVYVVTAADAGESLWLGPLNRGARRKGVVTVTADGCYTSQNTHILPMMRAQSLRASLAVVNSLVGQSGSFDWAALARHYGDGHNVLHHTFDATGGKTNGYVNATDWPTQESIRADVAAGFADLSARGLSRGVGYGVWGYALPFANTVGKTRQDLVVNAILAAGVRAMRNGAVSGGAYTRLQPFSSPSYVDPLSVQGAVQITNTTTAQEVKDAIDRARDRGEWAIITVHRSVASAPGSLEMTHANMDDWISYLGSQVRLGAVDCTPFDEVCASIGVSAI